MDVRRADVGIHDLEVAMGDVPGSGGRRDQVRPCIPLVNKRFYLHILPQIISF
jgi:hypothetical protein